MARESSCRLFPEGNLEKIKDAFEELSEQLGCEREGRFQQKTSLVPQKRLLLFPFIEFIPGNSIFPYPADKIGLYRLEIS